MAIPTIFSRWLQALDVPHTNDYSDSRFRELPFKSLFGLSHLLKCYGISSEGLVLHDKSEIKSLSAPFLAQMTDSSIVIVLSVCSDSVEFDRHGTVSRLSIAEFCNLWTGVVFIAYPDAASSEPDYHSHHLTELISRISKYALAVAALTVSGYFFITRGVYSHISTLLLTLLNCAGLYLSYMLLQKSLNIHTATSDRVCGVLERGGCDTIMSLKVSKLFGVFSWSEVGFGYFGVSLATLLMFPHLWPSLALCNACCLPYTVWSIWYQKFRAGHWCTLCVGVQSTLWLLFFCYLGGGWLARSLPLHPHFFILVATYIFAVLFLNMIIRIFKNLPSHEANSRT